MQCYQALKHPNFADVVLMPLVVYQVKYFKSFLFRMQFVQCLLYYDIHLYGHWLFLKSKFLVFEENIA